MSEFILAGVTCYQPSCRAQMVQALADFRRDWQKMVGGKNLIDVEASVGLVLADVADRLELNHQECHMILGGKLINPVNCVMEERLDARLPP